MDTRIEKRFFKKSKNKNLTSKKRLKKYGMTHLYHPCKVLMKIVIWADVLIK